MEAKNESPQHVQEEVRMLIELVRVVARALGFNNSALSRRAGVPLASLVRYFKGEGEPKMEFLVAVVRALGMEVREFFELAYPPPAAPSPARVKVEKILRPIDLARLQQPPPPVKPEPEPETAAPLRREDVERMLDDLRRDVREILEKQTRTAAASVKSERPRTRKQRLS